MCSCTQLTVDFIPLRTNQAHKLRDSMMKTTFPVLDAPWKTNTPIADVKKEVYRPNEAPGRAPMASMRYNGPGLERYEVQGTEVRDDVPEQRKFRRSPDNGRTWSEFKTLPDIPRICAGHEVLQHRFDGIYDPESGVLMGALLRQIQTPGLWNNFTSGDLSRDGGETWTQEQPLVYEPGAAFDPENPLCPDFLLKNHGYPGNSVLFHSNGTRLLFLCCANTTDDPENETRMWKAGVVCMIGNWDPRAADGKGDYRWHAGGRFSIPYSLSTRGLLEPEAMEIEGGRVVAVFRGSNEAPDGSVGIDEPGHKWFVTSNDAGKTFSAVKRWHYDDGTPFYSASAFHRTLRHSVTGKLYWLGNISDTPTQGNFPRSPLIFGEVCNRTGMLIKKTVMAIDDRRPDQGHEIQFSNFSFFEDREKHHIEIYLTAYGEVAGGDWRTANCYKYTVTLR